VRTQAIWVKERRTRTGRVVSIADRYPPTSRHDRCRNRRNIKDVTSAWLHRGARERGRSKSPSGRDCQRRSAGMHVDEPGGRQKQARPRLQGAQCQPTRQDQRVRVNSRLSLQNDSESISRVATTMAGPQGQRAIFPMDSLTEHRPAGRSSRTIKDPGWPRARGRRRLYLLGLPTPVLAGPSARNGDNTLYSGTRMECRMGTPTHR